MYLLLLCIVLVVALSLWHPPEAVKEKWNSLTASFHPRTVKFFAIVIGIFLLLAAFLIFNPDVGHFLKTAEVISA